MKRLSPNRPLDALRFDARGYAAAVLLVVCAALVAIAFRRLPHANLSLLFMLAVLIVAAQWGLWPSIFASISSFLTLNFFFTTPYYTLAVEEEGDLATLVFFLVMATLTGNLAARMRNEMAKNRAALAELRAARITSETERLRSTLLSSVSHDLRTPLASVIGSASSLLEYDDKLDPEHRRDLMQTVLDESRRLNRYIQNLLDMTRLGQHGFAPTRDWVDLNDLVASAIDRLAGALAEVTVRVAIDENAALVFVQGALIEQALVNLLENAADFAPPGSVVLVRAHNSTDSVVIEVVDAGPGVPDEDIERVFDMFYRARHGEGHPQGAGLGLAICRALVEAHGGSIRALRGDGGTGTCMQVVLPTTSKQMRADRA